MLSFWKIRNLKKNNIVLIFDECTSGFETFGGLHKKYG